MFSLSACGGTNTESETQPYSLPSALKNNTITESGTPSSADNPTNRVLVAYFSATGNTKKLAEYAAELLNADLYEIIPAMHYTSDDLKYSNDSCRVNREMEDENCRPEISGSVENMADYETEFIGYPIWCGEAPRIVSTFIESYDFSGKTVVTFCTSGSSSNNDSAIKALAGGANWISGTRLDSNFSQSDITDWISDLGLDLKVQK